MYIVLNYHLLNGNFFGKQYHKKPKTFVETIPDWTPEELVLNAIAWKDGYRFFGCSRNLSNVMKRPSIDNPAYSWLSTTMHRPDRGHEEAVFLQKNPTVKLETNN